MGSPQAYAQAFRVSCEYLRAVQRDADQVHQYWHKFADSLEHTGLANDFKQAVQLLALDVQNPGRKDLVSQRILHAYERDHMTTKAYGRLHEMEDLRILAPETIDAMIEQLLQGGHGRVDYPEVEDMILQHWIKTVQRIRSFKEN